MRIVLLVGSIGLPHADWAAGQRGQCRMINFSACLGFDPNQATVIAFRAANDAYRNGFLKGGPEMRFLRLAYGDFDIVSVAPTQAENFFSCPKKFAFAV